MVRSTAKVDLHLHSHASNITDYYAANSFAIPESYSDPIETYHKLKRAGMSLVTLTDHNSIDGVKEMLDAGLPDVFISAEMTTTFPEDGCNIHVTIANMTEAQFKEADRLRPNVYEMIAYVDGEIAREAERPNGNRLVYFMTHPLMSTQNRPYGREGSLSLEHIEKALLLCNCLEVRNGTRTKSLNELTRQLVTTLDPATIERLADKHGIAPKGATPWRKAVVGGSDDHSGINPGQTWTEFEFPAGARLNVDHLIDAIRERESRPGGAHGGPVTLAHAMLKLLYDGRSSPHRVAGARSMSIGGPVHSLLRLAFGSGKLRLHEKVAFGCRSLLRKLAQRSGDPRAAGRPFEKILAAEVDTLLADAQFLRTLAAAGRADDKIFHVLSTLVNTIFARYAARIADAGTPNIVRTIKELVALVSSNVFVSLPYLLSYFHQSSDRFIVRDVRKAFDIATGPRLVLVTDTFFEVNGVARTIRRMIHEARRRGIPFTVVTCLSAAEQEKHGADLEIQELIQEGRLKIFTSIVNLDFPEYEGLQIRFPPFLELLKYLQEEGFTKMQISTPGTVGVAGLLAAKTLQIETASTYHTSFPEYVENYTRDISLEALTWKYMILFYHAVDEVVVPSKFVARLLHKRGLRKRKLLVLDRWVDLGRFHPRHRVDGFWREHGIAEQADRCVKFIYFGRVGVEKNLAVLAEAYRRLRATRDDAHLIVVGDGPFKSRLQEKLKDLPATFLGFLEGEALSRAVASADVKLFPSTTDTWGNAVLEAQASGLPVVVTDVGGPQELMIDGVTGIKVRGRDVAGLHQAMLALMDRDTRTRMGRSARAFVEVHRMDEPFSAILDSDAYRRRVKELKHGASDDDAEAAIAPPELIGADYDDDIDLERPRASAAAAGHGGKVTP